MSDKKAKILVVVSAMILVIAGLVLYKVFDIQGYDKVKSGGYVNYNVNDYIETTPVLFNEYSDFYEDINVSRVNIMNIDSEIFEDFNKKQDEIIDYINGYYKEVNISEEYVPVSKVSSIIKTQVNETILSVFYKMQFDLDEYAFDESVKNYIITLNIDLGTEKLLTNQELLSKYDYSKKYISEKLFEEEILLSDGEIAIDKNTNISLTKNDVLRKRNEYIDRIVSEFDNIIKVYIENNSLVLVYDKRQLNEIFFDNNFNTDIKIKYLK